MALMYDIWIDSALKKNSPVPETDNYSIITDNFHADKDF